MKIFPAAIASLFLASGLALADHHKKSVDLEGIWNAVAGSDEGERKFTVTVAKEGSAFTGTSHSVENGKDRKIDRISVKEKKVTFEFDMERDGEKGLIKVIADEKAPGTLVGKWSVEGADGTVHMSGPWSAEKEVTFSLAGEWDSVGTTSEGEKHSSTMTISGSGADLKGKFAGEAGDLKIDTVKLKEKNLHLAFVLDFESTKVPTTIEAEATDDNTLEGKWIIKNESNEVAATGNWTAKRKVKPAFVLTGDWDIVATLPEDGEYNGTLSIQKKGGKISGSTKSDDGAPIELKTLTFDGKNLVYTIGIEVEGQDGIITVTGVKENDTSFKGRWSLTGPDKKEIAGNSWQATRGK
jgi:hypothetical protein|tara:strand:+ start:475 stop:1536 length:1062 start_codon:yes stop_codon:yes gene_type:complete